MLPAWAYLTATDGGPRAASWGTRTGLTQAQLAARNAVKLLPWQLAHLSVSRFVLPEEATVVGVDAYAASLALAAGTVVVAWRDPRHRALHDHLAGSTVGRA